MLHVLAKGRWKSAAWRITAGPASPTRPAPRGAAAAGLVEAERDGREVHTDWPTRVSWTACDLMRGVLLERARPPRSHPERTGGRGVEHVSETPLPGPVLGHGRQAPGGRRPGRRRRGARPPVHVFLQYWALDAFRRDRIDADHGLAPEAGEAGRAAVEALRAAGQASWAETLRQAKDLGGVDIQACSLSMDLLQLEPTDLDPLVDGVEGVTAFYLNAGDGQVVFI